MPGDDVFTLRQQLRRQLAWLPVRLGLRQAKSDAELAAAAPDIVVYEGHRFDIRHPRCTQQIAAALVRGSYEDREIALIRRHVSADDRVLELGACMGATSLVLHDIVGAENLLVVEADPRNLDMARGMFALNGVAIRMEHGVLMAGGNVPECVDFTSNANPSSSSLATREGAERAETVPALSFEEVLEREGSTALVLDIEGGEHDLFTRAASLGTLRLIVMETHPHVVGEAGMRAMHAGLAAHGFRLHRSYRAGQFLVLRRD